MERPRTEQPRYRITIEVTERQHEALERVLRTPSLGGSDDVADVLRYLIDRVSDAVRRPDSWEREWLEQAFGYLELDETDWWDHHGDEPFDNRPAGSVCAMPPAIDDRPQEVTLR